jgi:phosphoglycolate phosphatase
VPHRWILFDLDGTLVDSAADIARAANAAREALGYAPLRVETVKSYIGDGVDVLIARLVRPEHVARAKEVFRVRYARCLLESTRPYPGVEAVLARLRAAGRALAVVSNKPQAPTEAILRGLGLARHFGAVVGGDGRAGRKPEPGPFLEALRAIGGAPGKEALVVGDGRNDVAGARAAGLEVCAVTYGIGDAAEVSALAPDYVIGSIEELLAIAM